MRASTIFALIIAVLVSLGAVIAVKASGILAPREQKKEAPAPVVLVAAANIFEGTFIQASDVRLRPASVQEQREQKDGKLLPPVTAAAVKRIAAVNIPADTPLKEDYLDPMRAEELGRRLLPCERAINCCVNKQYCAGGLIKVGDLVDVQLITTVEGCEGRTSSDAGLGAAGDAAATTGSTGARNASAIIVRNARVIARRNSLYPVNTPLGPDCCINYTLAMNPYRAGLMEFVKDKGIVALLPLSEAERAQVMLPTGNLVGSVLDKASVDPAALNRAKAMGSDVAVVKKSDEGVVPGTTAPATSPKREGVVPATYDRVAGDPYCVNPLGTCRFSIPGNPEYKDEDQRVADYVAGLYTIGEHDLVRIFHLTCVQAPVPTTPTTVERINGVTFSGEDVFDPRTGRRTGFIGAANGNANNHAGGANSQGQGAGGIRLASQSTGFTGTQVGNSPGTVFRFRPPDASCLTTPATPVLVRRY
jgi:Flp pilus assembly protein CpaB